MGSGSCTAGSHVTLGRPSSAAVMPKAYRSTAVRLRVKRQKPNPTRLARLAGVVHGFGAQEQWEPIEANLGEVPLDVGGELDTQRRSLTSSCVKQPLPGKILLPLPRVT
jgi:hypothetical protein